MSIEIHCPGCDKRYRVKADLAGKRVRCSNCGNPVTVPNGQGDHGNAADASFSGAATFDSPPQPKRPGAAPPKAAPPPVPKQVVRHDPRFDPQAMADFPAPPPPSAPMPKQAPKRAPQGARQAPPEAGREIGFADEDPLDMGRPRVSNHDNLADTADGPAIGGHAPEPKLDEEPLLPRGKRGASKMASTASARAPDEPDLDIPSPDDAPALSSPAENTAMRRFREAQASGKEIRCIGCGAPMKTGAVICLNCGYNMATRERGAANPGNWEDAPAGSSGRWSRYFGKADWKPEDRALRKLCIFGVIVCLVPLIGLKVPQLIKPGLYIAYAGLSLAIMSAALFAKRMRFTRAAVAAASALIAFAIYSAYRPVDTSDLFAQTDDTPKKSTPQQPNPVHTPPKAKTTGNEAPTTEVMKILQGPAEGIDPMNWYLSYLSYDDPRVRLNSAQKLLEITPPGRKEEVARAFEARLKDEHPNIRRAAIKGVCLYIDDHTVNVLTPLLKDPEEEVRSDVYQVLAKMKDAKALPAIVARLAEDGTLAREALAAFDASQKPAITRAFELSLKSDNPRQRELAARELANWGGPNTPPLLLGLLDDNDTGVRCAAVITLGKLKDPQMLDAIIGRLAYDRTATITALQAFGPGAEKAVLGMLKTGNGDVRIAAAEVLGSIGTKDSIPALHDAAIDQDQRLSATAKEAWRKIAPDEFTPGLEAAVDIESESTDRVRGGLERLTELKPDKAQDRVAKILVRSAMSEAPLIREDALRALSVWGTKDSATSFLELLTEKVNPDRRQRAEMGLGAVRDPRGGPAVARFAAIDWPVSMQALMEMGPAAEDSVLELLMHERIDVRRDAVKCLKLWGSKQKALPALQGMLQRERDTMGRDILDAIAAIRERPNLPRKPLTQPAK